jgi:uracil-DNA glycosylase family 4
VTTEERRAALEAIAGEVRACDRCRLSQTRTNAVPGEGSPDTEVVFVGEGPGQNEDRQGRPFIGAAGNLLEGLLGMIGWKRDDVFITNVVKCRPPNNRDPEPDEIAACEPYLRRQLEILDPALLVTLGRFSLQMFMPGDRISRVHGTERAIDPETGARAATGYAMYHPAAALRQGALKETMQRDMAAVPEVLIRARAGRAANTSEPEATTQAPPPDPDLVTTPDPAIAADPSASTASASATPFAPAKPADTDPPTPPAPEAAETPEDETMKTPDDQIGLF